MSRAKSRRNIGFQEVLDKLKQQGISIRVASPKLVMEEVHIFYGKRYIILLIFRLRNHTRMSVM